MQFLTNVKNIGNQLILLYTIKHAMTNEVDFKPMLKREGDKTDEKFNGEKRADNHLDGRRRYLWRRKRITGSKEQLKKLATVQFYL